jgi:hypothetical protein
MYDKALRQVVAYVEAKCPSLIGLIASGTIIRGAPDRSSDLDIYVIQKDSYRQRIQKRFNSVPTEIFVNPPTAIERYLQDECSAGRPITAHMLAMGFVVLNLDETVDILRDKARNLLYNPPNLDREPTMSRYMIATAFEDATDIAERDECTARMILSQTIDQTIRYVFLKKGKYIPRLKDILKELLRLDPKVGSLATDFYSKSDLKELMHIAEQMMGLVIGSTGFFEWESEPETVEE